jgi:hypothetical protein
MKYKDYSDERDEITRPRKIDRKPRPKKANHKHEYQKTDEVLNGLYIMYKCLHCEKKVEGETIMGTDLLNWRKYGRS